MNTETWDDVAADWDGDRDVRNYADLAFDVFERKVVPLIPDLDRSRVLDFGCGTGLLVEKIAPLCGHVVAIDTSMEMIKVLEDKVAHRNLRNLRNVTPMATAIGSGEAQVLRDFQLVVASSVCSFLEDYEATLRDIASTMLPGGIFVQWDWLTEMPPDRIRRAFDYSGLRCLSTESEFEMTGKGGPMAVMMAIGRRQPERRQPDS